MTSSKWWKDEELAEEWNGVFQGGGAKGVAYVGALQAALAARCWFRATAGSSAGAITAALIAAGVHPRDMEESAAAGLAHVRKVRWWDHMRGASGADVPLFETEGLRSWLETTLRAQVAALTGSARPGEADVTFGELYAASGIDLYVVVLDADGRAPVVLSHHNAADTQVAHAVVASSAIPLALPKRRLVMAGGDEQWAVRRIFDGGAWANYPRFVFADASFRAFSRLPEIDPRVRTVGFALHVATDAPAVLDRPGPFVDSTVYNRRRVRTKRPWKLNLAAFGIGVGFAGILQLLFSGHPVFDWRVGAGMFAVSGLLLRIARGHVGAAVGEWLQVLLGTRTARLGVFVATAVCVGLVPLALHDLRNVFGLQNAGEDPSGGMLTVLSYVLFFTLPTTLLLMFLSFGIVLRFQSFLLEDAGPVLAASLGSAMRLPAWSGRGPGDHLIRVPVSPRVETTDFDLAEDARSRVIENARRATARRIVEILAVTPDQSSDPVDAGAPDQWRPQHDDLCPPPPPGQMGPVETTIAFIGFFLALMGIPLGFGLEQNADAGLNPHTWAAVTFVAAGVGAATCVLMFWRARRRMRRMRQRD